MRHSIGHFGDGAVTLKSGSKVIGSHTDRSTTYDFLLMFHTNQGPISHCLRDKRRTQSKIAKFSHPHVSCAPHWRGSAWNWVPALEVKKTTVMALPGWTRTLTTPSAVWIQSTSVTHGRTDRHRTTAKTALTHSITRVKTVHIKYHAIG